MTCGEDVEGTVGLGLAETQRIVPSRKVQDARMCCQHPRPSRPIQPDWQL